MCVCLLEASASVARWILDWSVGRSCGLMSMFFVDYFTLFCCLFEALTTWVARFFEFWGGRRFFLLASLAYRYLCFCFFVLFFSSSPRVLDLFWNRFLFEFFDLEQRYAHMIAVCQKKEYWDTCAVRKEACFIQMLEKRMGTCDLNLFFRGYEWGYKMSSYVFIFFQEYTNGFVFYFVVLPKFLSSFCSLPPQGRLEATVWYCYHDWGYEENQVFS